MMAGTQETKLSPLTQQNVLGMTILSQRLFMAYVLPNVCLMEHHNCHGVHFSAVLGRLCCYPKTQRNVCHGINHYSLVLRRVFSDPTQTGFQHMVSIQEGLLCSRLYPHFILGVGCKVIQSCNVQPELVGLGKLSKTRPQGHKLISGDVGGQLQDHLTHIVHSVVVQPETVGAVRSVHQEL